MARTAGRSIARNNIGVRSAEIALAVHRTLFRFCILAIAEDRHLIIPGYLRQVLDAEDSDRRLAEFFADAGDLWPGRRNIRTSLPGTNNPPGNVPRSMTR